MESVLPEKFGKGPLGLGDPDDKTLRRVEIDILIPKKMRDKTRKEKCTEQVKAFEECCKSSGIGMVVTCRVQNTALWDCLTKWYKDKEFFQICSEEYVKERSEYRKTGVRQKQKKTDANF